jgi:hypothetical protein
MVGRFGQKGATLFAIGAFLFPSVAAAGIGRESLSGTALIRTDERQRIVVAVDTDHDGTADQLFLFDPFEPLLRPITPVLTNADLVLDDDRLVVTARDGSVKVDVRTSLPRQGEPATSMKGTTIVASGHALARFYLNRDPSLEGVKLTEIDTSGYPTLETSPICGGSDTDCSAGGRGSTSCSTGCDSGGGSQAGLTILGNGASGGGNKPNIAPCSASCGDGSYACCRCDEGASASKPTARCTCRTTASLQACPK